MLFQNLKALLVAKLQALKLGAPNNENIPHSKWRKYSISSIVGEVNKTVFFFTKHILNLKYTKQ